MTRGVELLFLKWYYLKSPNSKHYENQLIEIYKICDFLGSIIFNFPMVCKYRNFEVFFFRNYDFFKQEEN